MTNSISFNEGKDQHWYRKGRLHREDGPAVYGLGTAGSYYLHGQYYTQAEWEIAIEIAMERRNRL